MLNREVGVIYRVLQDSGIEVDVATTSGDPISVGSVNFTPDLRVSDVTVSEYSAFILPCMAAGRFVDPGAVRMITEAAAADKLIAAQFNSLYTVAEAGLLEGREYAYGAEVDATQNPGFAGARYSGEGVVRDGHLITSGICPYMARQRGVPDQTEEFAEMVIDAIQSGA
jgi:putative intracellular protease/amidase